jgi:hypothetical protein
VADASDLSGDLQAGCPPPILKRSFSTFYAAEFPTL